MARPHVQQPLSPDQANLLLHIRRFRGDPPKVIAWAAGVYENGRGLSKATSTLDSLVDLGLAKAHEDYARGDYKDLNGNFISHPKVYRLASNHVVVHGRDINMRHTTFGDLTA